MDTKKKANELRKLADFLESGQAFEVRGNGGVWTEGDPEVEFEVRKAVNRTPVTTPVEGSFIYYPDLTMPKGVGVGYYSEKTYGALAARNVIFDNEEAVIDLVEKWTTTQK